MNAKNFFKKLKKHRKVFLVLVILLIGIACVYSIYNYNREKFIGPLETIIYAPEYLTAGTDASLRMIILERGNLKPVEGAKVSIRLKELKTKQKKRLFSGKSNLNGSPDIKFKVPDGVEGDCELLINIHSDKGDDDVSIPVTVKGINILLTSDRTAYRPGETIHIRGLFFENSKAANQKTVIVEVFEPKGNLVFKRELQTCNYGIANADFTLGGEINTGTYTIRANMGDYREEKKVQVSNDLPPTFKVACTTEKTWYLPGQTVKGKIKAAYFFGKPVKQGKVRVFLFKTHKEKMEKIADFSGTTDPKGVFEFAHQLPQDKKVQIKKESSGLSYQLHIDAAVQDSFDQLEKVTRLIPVSRDNILIRLIPESGKPKIGLENTIYATTTYPDGRPADCELDIETWIGGDPKNTQKNIKGIQTNQWGIGELKLNITPQQQDDLLHLVVRDSQGNTGEKLWSYSLVENQKENIILRTDKSIYHVGETASLAILSTQKQGHIYVDILKNNQVILTKNPELKDGKSHMKLQINEKMPGTLTCCARMTAAPEKPGDFSSVLRDMQKIIVQPEKDNEIHMAFHMEKNRYYPGEEASVNVFTSRKGQPCAAALGINVVDEFIQAVNQKAFGFEKFYYNIDKLLLEPDVSYAGFSFPQLWKKEKSVTPTLGEKQQISTVLLASQLPDFYRLKGLNEVSSAKQNVRNSSEKKRKFQIFQMYLLMIILILMAIILLYSIKKKEKRLFLAILLFVLYMVTFHGVMDFFSSYSNAGISSALPLLPLISSLLIPLVFTVYGIHFLRSRDKRTVLLTFLVIIVCILPLILGVAYYKPLKGPVGESMKVSLLPKFSPQEEVDKREISKQPIKPAEFAEKHANPFSPGTLYFNSRIITDKNGRASFTVKIPEYDTVDKWQVTALAHTLEGKMGTGGSGLPVSRDLLVKMEMPTSLIQDDEISFPVTLYNFHSYPKNVKLKLQQGNWFGLSGPASRAVTVKGNDNKVVYFKIRAKTPGDHRMAIQAQWTSDKTLKDIFFEKVTIIPDGKEIRNTFNYILSGDGEFKKRIPVPETAIRDSDNLLVKIYPGYFSQVTEGMESMLRMPHGCFEQTTSVLYPDVMVLEYLKKSGKSTPAIEEKAESYIAGGYQQLLPYESTPGGFSFYGGTPQKIPTAYGLLIFSDIARVYTIDSKLIPRIQKWLLSKMTGDHWEPDGHFGASASARDNNFAATAYVTWALLHSGLDKNNKKIRKALDYLEKDYETYSKNPNALSYCALSLVKAERNAVPVLHRLNRLAIKDSNGIYWPPAPNAIGARMFSAGTIETTAIAALANLEANDPSHDVSQILHFLLKNKGGYGTWGSTQATVLTLKVLIEALPKSSGDVFGMVNIWVNNEHAEKLIFTGENQDNMIMNEVDLKEFIGVGNPEVQVKFEGRGELFCQILSSYYLRWDEPSIGYTSKMSPIKLDLACDTKRLNRSEILTTEAAASYTGKGMVNYVIIDLGIPPGFKVKTGDFNKFVSKGLIDRFEIDQGRILVYLNSLDKKERRFQYRLKAISPGRVRMPESKIYDYYDPEVIAAVQPISLTVVE